jgi:hypothetical protein
MVGTEFGPPGELEALGERVVPSSRRPMDGLVVDGGVLSFAGSADCASGAGSGPQARLLVECRRLVHGHLLRLLLVRARTMW